MKENKIYYQVTCRKFGESHNTTVIYHYNSMLEAFEKYMHCFKVYGGLDEYNRMKVSVELYKIDRSTNNVEDVATVVACGYDIVNNYVYDTETYNEMRAQYYEKFSTLS